MRTQILIQQGMVQVVLTPETPIEKTLVASITPGSMAVTARRGTFDLCRGGYIREFDQPDNDGSLILLLTDEKQEATTAPTKGGDL